MKTNMTSTTFFLVCLQALLVAQCAYCQILNYGCAGNGGLMPGLGYNNGLINNGLGLGYGQAGLIGAGLNGIGVGVNGLGIGAGLPLGYAGVPSVAATASVPVAGPFVSTGAAELAVGGDFGVGGSTVVGGQVPVVGAVSFGGQIPAAGVVSIAGNCGCASYPL